MLVRVAARPVAPGHAPRRVIGAGGALGCSGTSGENQRQLVDTVAKYISRYQCGQLKISDINCGQQEIDISYQLWTIRDIRNLLWTTTEISDFIMAAILCDFHYI